MHGIHAPTLVISGSADLPTPRADGEFLASRIAGAQLAVFHAAHLSNLEVASQFSETVIAFLLSRP